MSGSTDAPLTYLNKGQTYVVNVADQKPEIASRGRYRTTFCIVFEEEKHRQQPWKLWRLWKEYRGLSEARARGAELHAIEWAPYEKEGEAVSGDTDIELESTEFDRFSLKWGSVSGSSSPRSCSTSIRFNFLSTDFNPAKGVRGTTVRLVAKTEALGSSQMSRSEACYCKVKLFRDRGAERKLSSDVVQFHKALGSLKQQVESLEASTHDTNSGSFRDLEARGSQPLECKKQRKCRHASCHKTSKDVEVLENLRPKLAKMQELSTLSQKATMFSSRCSVKDLDLCFASLASDVEYCDQSKLALPTWSTDEQPNVCIRQDLSPHDVELNEVKPPTVLVASQTRGDETFAQSPSARSKCSRVAAFSVSSSDRGMDWTQALEQSISARAHQGAIEPTQDFSILIKYQDGILHDDDVYRSVHLKDRTVMTLASRIATRCGISPGGIKRIYRQNVKGLKIEVDDGMVQAIPSGQDMIVRFLALHLSATHHSDFGSELMGRGAPSIIREDQLPGWEMRLLF